MYAGSVFGSTIITLYILRSSIVLYTYSTCTLRPENQIIEIKYSNEKVVSLFYE